MGNTRRIAGYIFVTACGGLALSVFFAPYINEDYSAVFSQYFTVVGVVVTAIAFCFGTYYAVLAVSAYSHHRDIEALARETKNRADRIETMEEELGKTISGVKAQSDHLYRQIDAVFASLIVSFQYSDMLPLIIKKDFLKCCQSIGRS